MDVLNLTQYEIYLKCIPTTANVIKLPYKVPFYQTVIRLENSSS